MGEILVVKIEPTNRHDIHAVAIYEIPSLIAKIVGHVPYNLAPRMSAFFKSQEPKATGKSLLADGYYNL